MVSHHRKIQKRKGREELLKGITEESITVSPKDEIQGLTMKN